MTLEQLRMFVTVADHGSIVKAAQSLHKTQPAISIAIKRLQEELGLILLTKTANRLQLTVDGERLLPHCRYLLRQQQDIKTLAAHLSDGHERKIEFAFDTMCHQLSFYDAISFTQQQFPQTEIYLTTVQRLGALRKVVDGTADMAITPWMLSFHEQASFENLPYGQFEVVAVAHQDIFKRIQTPISNSSHLQDIPLLMPQSFDIEINIEKVMGVVHHSTIRTNDAESQRQLLVRGVGWGYIPKHTITDELASGLLRELDLDDVTTKIAGEIHLIRDKRHAMGPVARFLWEQLALCSAIHNQ